ncbi:MAG: hypothetical protein P1V35_16600 [Planctomycetota bacterium]|nr:hypothetical protein [Planctomycetota bacterium]
MEAYKRAWAAISGSLSSGSSWSGHEHNNAWLNVFGQEFLDVSDTTGLAYESDGRGVARVDWDGDGDLDLWIRSRTAPGIRYVENQADPDHIRLSLRAISGDQKGHRADAIGARIRLVSNFRTTVHEIRAGEGYLSQSSDQFVRALTPPNRKSAIPGEQIISIGVTWPNGEHAEYAMGHSGSGAYRIFQGKDSVQPVKSRPEFKGLDAGPLETHAGAQRVILRSPLPMPWRKIPESEPKGSLILIVTGPGSESLNMGALKALRDAHGMHVEIHVAKGLTKLGSDWTSSPVMGWPFDELDDIGVKGWSTLQKHIVTFAQPDSVLWLIDATGAAQSMYMNGWNPDQLGQDIERFVNNKCPGAERGAGMGRWFHGAPRGLEYLSQALKEAGCKRWAASYSD